MIIYRSWKAPTAPSAPRTCSARARHDDTPSRPHDLGHRPLSQRSFLWPKRLTAGGAGAKEASSGAVGPGEALGTLVTISGYVKRPRYARLNTPMGADGAISCMSCASYHWATRLSQFSESRSSSRYRQADIDSLVGGGGGGACAQARRLQRGSEPPKPWARAGRSLVGARLVCLPAASPPEPQP